MYELDRCDELLEKIAQIGVGAPAVPPQASQGPMQAGPESPMMGSQESMGGTTPLGTIGAEMGGSGAGAGAGAVGPKSFSVNKDQLYERIIAEKDIVSKLKMQLAMSGQDPAAMGPVGDPENPLGNVIQQAMTQQIQQDMSGQVDPMQQPMGQDYAGRMEPGMEMQQPGMEVTAALKKKFARRSELKEKLEKEAIAPLALLGTAATGYFGAQALGDLANIGIGGARRGYETLENQAVGNNPFIANQIARRQARRRFVNPMSKAWYGSIGGLPQNRQFRFAGDRMSPSRSDFNGVGAGAR